MFIRGKPLAMIIVLGVWYVAQPLVQELMRVAGVAVWVRWSLFPAGAALVVVWFLLWLHSTAAPLRARLEKGRREHPDSVTELVALDPEWNLVEGRTVTLLVADHAAFALEGDLVRVAAADVESVSTTHVTPRRQAIVIAVPGATWTCTVLKASWWRLAGGRVVHDTADRIANSLGAPRT